MNDIKEIEIREDSFEIVSNKKDSIIIQRHYLKHTKLDLEIQTLPIPKKPIWLNITVRVIRLYQKYVSEKVEKRCVFDPSCSRYAEVAFRKKGFFNGMSLAIKRVKRCHPKNGGVDQLR